MIQIQDKYLDIPLIQGGMGAVSYTHLDVYKRQVYSVLLYIGIGLLGIPVFASGGGISYVLVPSFGYLIGFVEMCIRDRSECISYSIRLMRKNIFNFFELYLVYMLRHMIYWVLTGIVILIVGSINELLMLFCICLLYTSR